MEYPRDHKETRNSLKIRVNLPLVRVYLDPKNSYTEEVPELQRDSHP